MNREIKIVSTNRKTYFNYFVETEYTSGVVLHGCEIKSIRNGEINISDGYCVFQNGELWLKNMYIKPYKNRDGFMSNIDSNRDRKLLLTKHELRRLDQKIKVKGYTLVPTKVIINENGLCKIIVGLCKGKKEFDKKQTIKDRDIKRDIDRELS